MRKKSIFILPFLVLMASLALAQAGADKTDNTPQAIVEDAHHDPYKCFNSSINCLTLIVLVVGLIYAGKQLKSLRKIHTDNHEWNRRIATQDVLFKYEELSDIKAALNAELDHLNAIYPIDVGVINKLFKEKPHLKLSCNRLLNYYESLAIGVFWGIYEEDVVIASLKTNIITTYKVFSSFITNERHHGKKEHSTLYEYFEKLVKRWESDKDIPDPNEKKIATE